MATKKRKIEVHRLTISGLPRGTAYGPFLRNLSALAAGSDQSNCLIYQRKVA
jgi:hypothetical protein